MSLANSILAFYTELRFTGRLPKGVHVMNPYQDTNVFAFCSLFYQRFYSDSIPRKLILGINPGRFGGGVTGIPFTDPIRMATPCGIENNLNKKPELSSEFIYRMIEAFGGAEKFYSQYLISAICPLGFTKDGKNLNYYDLRELQYAAEPFIIGSLQKHLEWGVARDQCFCLGEGKNYNYLKDLNEKHKFFGEIIPLAHPRFIMQYRRKQLDHYINEYISKLS